MTAVQVVWPAISSAKLRLARRLSSAKGRDAEGAFLAEGPQAVREALAFGEVLAVVVSASATDEAQGLADVAVESGLTVLGADDDQMAQITDTVHGQGVVALCRRPSAALQDLEGTLFLVLDEVRDPGNVGTLIRTADALGVAAVIATIGTAEVFAPKVVRASVGSVFHLPVVTGVSFEDAVAWSRSRGHRLIGADANGDPLPGGFAEPWQPTVWVLGNEAHGISSDHLHMLDQALAVPMWGKAESLNVGIAGAICLWESALIQQRGRPSAP